jgi:DNA polymerase-1
MIARQLLATHRHTYRKFWEWSETFCDTALWRRQARTVFGWPAIVGHEYNPRSLANFPMQANGAEMLRIACCLATERGIEVCAPVHDAVLIAAPLDRIKADVSAMRACMVEASRAVLDGFALRVEVDGADDDKDGIIRYPDRYMDGRNGSREMWDRIWKMVDQLEKEAA